MRFFLFLLSYTLATDISTLMQNSARMEEEVNSMGQLLLKLKVKVIQDTLNSSRLIEMNTQIFNLKEDILHLEKSVSHLERIATRALEEHKEFDIHKAEDILEFIQALAGQVAVLQSKLINLYDQEIMDKIHKSMQGVTQNDQNIEKSIYKLFDSIETLHISMKDGTSLGYIYLMNAIVIHI